MRNQIKELATQGYGWEFVENNKNPYMDSYINLDGDRINYYFTSGTVTLQTPDRKMTTIRNATLNDVEKLLC